MNLKQCLASSLLASSIFSFAPNIAYSQETVALIGFKGIGISEDITRSIEERIESGLPGYCQCPVISQQEIDGSLLVYLNKRAIAHDYTSSGFNSPGSVEKIVSGTLSRVGPSYSMVLKLIEVKTGIIERSVRREHSGSIEALFQFSDATVAALFEKIKPIVDTIFVPIAATIPAASEPQRPRKEEPQNQKSNSLSTVSDNKTESNHRMEKIGIGAIAIFAAIAAIILTNISR